MLFEIWSGKKPSIKHLKTFGLLLTLYHKIIYKFICKWSTPKREQLSILPRLEVCCLHVPCNHPSNFVHSIKSSPCSNYSKTQEWLKWALCHHCLYLHSTECNLRHNRRPNQSFFRPIVACNNRSSLVSSSQLTQHPIPNHLITKQSLEIYFNNWSSAQHLLHQAFSNVQLSSSTIFLIVEKNTSRPMRSKPIFILKVKRPIQLWDHLFYQKKWWRAFKSALIPLVTTLQVYPKKHLFQQYIGQPRTNITKPPL